MRKVSYAWADHDGDGIIDCDVNHELSTITGLPDDEIVNCKVCTRGMERDA